MNFLILVCFSETTAVLLIVDLRKRKHTAWLLTV